MVDVDAPPPVRPGAAVVEVTAPVVEVADPVEVELAARRRADRRGRVVTAPLVVVVDGGAVVGVTVVVGTGVVATYTRVGGGVRTSR